jgi:signal transduction histidine kinase
MAAVGPAAQARGDVGRPEGRAGAAAAFVVWCAALVTVVGTAAATAGTDPGAAVERTVHSALVVLVLAGPVTAGVAAWWVRADRPHVAIGLAVAAGATAVPLWSGWAALPDVVRAGTLAAPVLAVAGTAQVLLCWSSGNCRSGSLRLTYALAAAAFAVHLVGYDPLADLSCARTCADIAPLLGSLLPSRLAVLLAGVLTLAAVGVAGTAMLSRAASGAPTSVRAGAVLSLGVLGTASVVRTAAAGGADLQGVVLVLLPAAVLPVAGAVAAAALRTARVRAAVARIADQLARPVGTSTGRGPSLGDVHFAVTADGRRWVDAEGREVDAVPAGSALLLRDSAGPAVRLVPTPQVDRDTVTAALTPARRLALDNARLTAVTRAHLADLRASQRRVVARSDAERRRIERDLHDGIQQRLVSAALHLSAARSRTGTTPGMQLAACDVDLRRSLAELRRISRGVLPEGLLDEGLGVALDELVRECDREATLETSGDLPTRTDIATAVYATVRAVLESGSWTQGTATVRVGVAGGLVSTAVAVPGDPDPASAYVFQDVADRVGAVGGRFRCRAGDGRTTVTVEIPCAS